MKKIHMIAALLAMLLPTVAWGGGTATYYAKLTTGLTSSSPTGSGTVYIGETAATSSSTYSADTRSKTNSASEDYSSSKPSSLNVTFYLSAKASYGYKFVGWYDNVAGTGTAKSSNADYSPSVKASGTSTSSPTDGGGCYAKFAQNTDGYTVNLVAPEGLSSYSVTGPTGFNGSGLSNGGNFTAYKGDSFTFSATVATGYEFVKWTVNGADAGTSTTLTKTFSSASTVQAVVNKLVTYYATCQAAPAGCSYKVGSTTVSGTEQQVSGYGTLTVNLSAPTAANGYLFAGWYTIEDGNKTIFSTDSSTTVTKKADVTLGADFVAITAPVMLMTTAGTVDYDDFDAAFAAAKSGDKIKVVGNGTLTATAAVASGVTLEVASGVTLTVASGATLYIDGSATVNGTISGTVSKCTKLIKQTGQSDGVPFNPYGSVKYWKTSITTPSISVSSSATHTTIVNGLGQVFRTTLSSSAKLIKCTIDSSVAVNHIKSIAGESTSVNVVNDTLNSGMVILLGSDCVINGGLTAKAGFRGVVDCANFSCSTITTKEVSGNNGKATFLNCPSFTGSKVINITHDYFNCDRVTLSSFNAGNTATLNFYDCGTAATPATFSVGSYSSGPSATTTHNFYSGYYNSLSYKTCYKVYGGSYKNDPSNYNADVDNLEVVYDSVGKWYNVLPAVPAEKVCAIGGMEYTSLSAAIDAAANGDTITLIAAVDMAQGTAIVPSGKNITISLEKHSISNGKIVNNGTLTIVDSTIDNDGDVASDIENNGTLDFVFGTYSGAVVNKTGTLTVHNGAFTGSFTKTGGTVNLKGGHFKTDVSSLVTTDDYLAYGSGGFYYVCEVPNGTMSETTVSGKSGYSATPYNDADYNLLKERVSNNKTTKSDYTATNWIRLAELLTFYEVFYNASLDATLQFDRVVPANSLSAYASTGLIPQSLQIKHDLDAGELYRGLSAVLVGNGYYGKQYKALWEDSIKSVSLAVSDGSSGSNAGTLCRTMIELWTSVRAPDYHDPDNKHMLTNTLYVAGQKLFTLGAGSNVAMIRPAAGAATFYATLGDAMDAAADGGTVMLANDCDTALPLNKAGTYTFDTMGFAASDAVSVGDGLFVKSETTVDSSAKVLVPDAKATTYVVAQKVASVGGTFYDNLTEAVGAANGATVTLLVATDETITLTAEGQTLSLNKNGIAFDDTKVVTSVEGSSVKATTSEGVTVYSLVKDVVTSGEAHYPSIEAAIEAAEGNTVAVTVVAADTETIDLDAGKTLVVTVADGVTANVTVDPGEGAFIDTTTSGSTTTYESKKITVAMAEPQSGATVEVTKIEGGKETAVSDSSEINAAVTQLMGNHDVPRTDNTDKLDVLDKITVTPTKIVEEVVDSKTVIRSATFDVTPAYNAGQSLGEGQKLKFRLPVDAAATQLAAVVYHGDAQFGIFAVQTYNNEKFVEVESDTFSPYGYELLDGETANPIAAIGTTGYASLAAAVAAASAGDTITMLADDNVSLTGGSRLTIDKSLTITGPVDTNGEPLYTIYGKSNATGTNNIYIDGSGTVTLSNLKIKDFGNNTGTDGSHAPVYVASSFTGTANLDNLYISDFNRGGVFLYGGTFNVTDCYIDCANSRSGAFTKGIEIKGTATGTIADTVICNMERSSTTYSTAGIEVYGNGTITVDGCTILSDVDPHQSVKGTYGIVSSRVGEHDPSGGSLHVTDCYIDVSNAALSVADDDEYGPVNNYSIVVDGEDTYFSNYIATWSAGSSITVAEGEFNEDVYADAGTINITGGTFNNFLPDTGTGTISISGGIFDKEVSEAYCAEGYIPAVYDEDTGLYTVKQGAYVAQIGDVKYETFAEAIAAAEAMSPVPTITVIDATAVQENNGWMFSQDGNTLFHKVAMVVFSTDKYATATTTYYPSAAEAFAAADEFVYTAAGSIRYLNTDVTLLADDTLPGDATTVIEGKKQGGYYDYRSIDLNGHTLVAPKGVAIERVSANVTMKILDSSESKTGSIVNPSTDADAFALRVNSMVSMTMESGSIVAKGAGTALKTIGTGSATLNGGSISADPDGKAINSLDTSSVKMPEESAIVVTGPLVETAGSIEVKGGSFSSAVPAECIATGYEDAGQTAVVAGYYTVKREVYTITFLDENDNVIISGQLEYNALYSTLPVPAIPVKVSDDPAFYYTGAWAPSASTSTRATGNATHKLTYTQGKYGFQYGDGLYTNTLANAYKAVADGGTVTVLNDAFALTSTLNLAKDVTIDLNGSVLTLNNTGMLTVSGEGTKVTFANGTITKGSGSTARDAFVKAASSADVAFKDVVMQGADPYTTAVLASGEGSSATFDGACVISMPEGKQAVTAANGATVAISGGLYSTEVPVAYCAADYKPADGTVEYDGKNYYTVTLKGVAQIGDTYYDTFAAAIAAANAAVAGGDDDPVIIALDPTAAQDNGDWKFVTDDSVVPAVTKLVRKVYVAQIDTTKYETVEAALADAQGSGATIEILANSTETPDHALEVLMGGNITLTAATPVRVEIAPTAKTSSVDTDGMAYIRSASAAARCTFTVGENVTLAFPATAAGKGAMYIGYSSANAADVVINGRLELYEPYVGSLSTLTVNPSGSIKSISECLIVRWGATVDIVGTGAEWSDANPQAEFAYVSLQGGVTTLKDTYAKGGAWVQIYDRNNKAPDYATKLVLDNAVLATSKINNQAVIELDVDSQIVTPVVQNTGSINIDATGITQAAKIIDYTGSGTLALADYGTVTVTAGEAYVEDNDLWVKKPAVAQIGTTKYDTFAEAIAAADAAVAGGNDDPVIIALDPTAAQDNVDWKFVTDDSEPPVTTLVRKVYVAQIGTTKYETLADAITAAQTGDTVQLLKDVDVSSVVLVGKSITIDGDGHKITTSTATRVIRVTTANIDVTFKDLEILSTCGTPGSDGDYRGISIDVPMSNLKVTLDNVKLTAPAYAFNVVGGSNLTFVFKDSELKGWAAINSFASDSTFAITNSTLHGYNDKSLSEWHNFAVISLDGNSGAGCNNTVTIHDSQIVSESTTGNYEWWVYPHNGSVNNAIIVSGNSSIVNANDENDILNFYFANADLTSSITVPASMLAGIEDVDNKLRAKTTARTDNGDGTYTIKKFSPVAMIGSLKYESFAAAIAAADAAVAAGEMDPDIMVLDSSAPLTNPDWKISNTGYLVRKVYVAQIVTDAGATTNKYETLQDAVAAAQAGATIEVIADDEVSLANGQEVTIDKPLTITGAVDEDGIPVYTISGTADQTGYNDIFVASSSGTVTISNLGIDGFGCETANSSNGHAPIFVSSGNNSVVLDNLYISNFNRTGIKINGGKFLVTNCLIDCSTYMENYRIGGVDVVNAATGAFVGTTITDVGTSDPTTWVSAALELLGSGAIRVEDCEFTSAINGIFVSTADHTTEGSSAVTVINTTIDADLYSLANDSDAEGAVIAVESGKFTGMLSSEDETGLSISGGIFDDEVFEGYCASGFIPAANTDAETSAVYPYTVKEGSYVAQIVRGGEVIAKYETFTNALEAAESDDTVQLLANVEDVTETFVLHGKNITIDGQGQYSIVAGENTEPRSVVQSYGGARNMFVVQSGNVTFKDITLDGGETHYYTFLVQAKSGTTTFDNVSLLHGGEADSSSTAGVGYGAAVQVDGATVLVTNSFYACTGTNVNDVTTGVFPFTALLYQAGGIHFADGVTAGIGDDLLLVGMVGAVDVSTEAGRAQVSEMLEAMNVPAGYYPYTLKLGDSEMTSFTGASPLGWNGIIDYGKEIMTTTSSLGMEMNPATTPVEVGLLTDTVLPDTFRFADTNFTVNGNGNALAGTIEYTDNAGQIHDIVMGTEGNALVLDMTDTTKPIVIGSGISVSNVTIQMTAEQATAGTPVIIWDAAHGVDAPENEAGVTVLIVDDQGDSTGVTKELIWDDEMGMAYIGPCEARLTGPTHDKPIYTTLADAIELAAQTNDTVTLLMNVTNVTTTYEISKQDLVIDGAGYTVAAAPVTEHRNMFDAFGGGRSMFKVESGSVTFKNIELDGDVTHAYTYLVSANNSSVTLTTENVRLIHGGEISKDSNNATVTPGNGYGAAIHLNNGAHLIVSNGFYACTGTNVNGVTTGVFPFTAILPENLEAGTSVAFELTGDPNAPANVDIGDDLLLVGMIGDLIEQYGIDNVQGILNYMKVPSRFIPYTLTLADGSAYAFTGASPRRWNEIIDYGKDIMDVATANGFSGLDKDTTPVEVGLATDTILPAGADGDGYDFLYEDSNFSINGNGNALSGTIKFTDDAKGGLMHDIDLGTDDAPLTLDLSATTNAVMLGGDVIISNVVVKLTEDQATLGKVVFEWDSGETPPDDEQGVEVTVVNNSGTPTGETKGLVWDEEYGVAYIGPVEARLTGSTHETPVYTSLANALDIAKDGDKVELLTNAVLSAVQGVGSDVTLDLAGYKVSVNGAKGLLVTNATLVIADTSVKTNGTICAGDEASPASLIESGNGGVVNIPTGIFAAASGQNVLVTSDNGAFAVSGGYFSNPVLPEHCAPGYAPIEAPAGAPQQYTVGETVPEFRYPIDGTAGVPVTNTWLATYMSDIYDDPTKPIFANITNDLVQALSVDGANGIPRWESYVLGLDPTDPKAQLRLTATSKDTATVTITGLIDTTKFPEIENVAVTFRLAEQNSDKWTDVDGCTGSDVPSFTRPLEGVADKVLRIFADIEVR